MRKTSAPARVWTRRCARVRAARRRPRRLRPLVLSMECQCPESFVRQDRSAFVPQPRDSGATSIVKIDIVIVVVAEQEWLLQLRPEPGADFPAVAAIRLRTR